MFERLTDTFQGLYKKLSGQGSITEKNVSDAMSDVRAALLNADVHVEVVDTFCEAILKDALGREVTKSLRPGEEMVGIVHKRLVEFLGGEVRAPNAQDEADFGPLAALMPKMPDASKRATDTEAIMRLSPGPTIVMMCGLQGSGKTTTCGKLAGYLKKRGRSVMLAAADLQRPAAVEQLETIAGQADRDLPGSAKVSFYAEKDKVAEYGKAVGVAVQVCRHALDAARKANVDVLILDTAGRLHVNDALMGELKQIKNSLQPHHIFLVVDAMTGQDAVNSAKSFHERLEVDGIILTKYDSDTRGGAAISVKHVTGAPIKFVGVGEKLDAIEEFHPERVAGRILGMGDVVALVEKAQEEVSAEDAQRMEAKLAKGEMDMQDFLGQLKTLRRMGPLKQLLGLLPGVGSMLKDVHIDDKHLDRVEAIISSMTKAERARPSLLDNSRRKRIAKGSGTKVEEISQLVKQFDMINKLSKTMSGAAGGNRIEAVKQLSKQGGMGAAVPGLQGMPGFMTKGSTAMSSPKDKFKKRRK
jgi:signal recognition particle subunit SRP54